MMIACAHATTKKFGKDRNGNQRYPLLALRQDLGGSGQPKPLGEMQVPVADAKLALRLLVEGMSIRGTAASPGLHREHGSASCWSSSAKPAGGSLTSGCAASR